MASNLVYTVTKNPDGDFNMGNWNGEMVTLQPANSDYPPGGYPIYPQKLAVDGTITAGQVNCDLWQINTALPAGGQGGYTPVWNAATSKLQVFQDSTSMGPGGEVTGGKDLSAFAFQLLLLGY